MGRSWSRAGARAVAPGQPIPWSGAQAVVLVPPCLLLPSSQGFFTAIATELLFSFSAFVRPLKAGLWLLSSRGDSLQPEARDQQFPPGNQRTLYPWFSLVLLEHLTHIWSHCRRSAVEVQWAFVQHCIQLGEGMSPRAWWSPSHPIKGNSQEQQLTAQGTFPGPGAQIAACFH